MNLLPNNSRQGVPPAMPNIPIFLCLKLGGCNAPLVLQLPCNMSKTCQVNDLYHGELILARHKLCTLASWGGILDNPISQG